MAARFCSGTKWEAQTRRDETLLGDQEQLIRYIGKYKFKIKFGPSDKNNGLASDSEICSRDKIYMGTTARWKGGKGYMPPIR
jgi:hypothetical protein